MPAAAAAAAAAARPALAEHGHARAAAHRRGLWRHHLARELHGGVGRALAVVVAAAAGLRRDGRSAHDKAAARAARVPVAHHAVAAAGQHNGLLHAAGRGAQFG
eukprot:scaffold659_cov329-Prasinococcus_capsulatus_cf.AAC.30